MAVYPNNRRKQVLDAIAGPFWCFMRQDMFNLSEFSLTLR